VRQILVNLISNAVKFTTPGGSVRLFCGGAKHGDPGARLVGSGPWTFIRVVDTGIGIPDEQLVRIFEPFVQAESGYTRTEGGTGLGLAISRRLARLMGGDITVQSEVGRGSTFTLWLRGGSADVKSTPTAEYPAFREEVTEVDVAAVRRLARALKGRFEADGSMVPTSPRR
jgi:signal transduction histidine kinase